MTVTDKSKVMIGKVWPTCLYIIDVMTLGFMLMHGRKDYTLIELQGVSIGSVVARGPIDKSKLPAFFCVFLTNE